MNEYCETGRDARIKVQFILWKPYDNYVTILDRRDTSADSITLYVASSSHKSPRLYTQLRAEERKKERKRYEGG